MTRIVAGVAKGRRLVVPARGTRPTSERARGALFNSLHGLVEIDGARVLDLFAGTGAVGLEALSRGATEVHLVESDRAACDVLRRNIASVGVDGATLHRAQAASFLVARAPDEPFDVTFLDPPYAYRDDHLATLLGLLAERWLAADAVVVVERAVRSDEPRWPAQVTPLKQRRYGEGMLWYGRAQ
jgi:16S rRNA (guanine966-N2)-methyltransferase